MIQSSAPFSKTEIDSGFEQKMIQVEAKLIQVSNDSEFRWKQK